MRFSFDQTGVPKNYLDEKSARSFSCASRLNQAVSGSGYNLPEASLYLPFDQSITDKIKAVCSEKVAGPLKKLAIVGIGGSNLGAKAVYDALIGYKDALGQNDGPRAVFLDTNDPYITEASAVFLEGAADSREILILLISKSGTTTESIANFEYLISALKNKFPDIESRVIVITDKNSALDNFASQKNMPVLDIPEKTGGRFSIFSPVGLLPLYLLGVDTEELKRGAREITKECLLPDMGKNPAIISAAFLSFWHNEGKRIHDVFFFNPEMETLGKWYRQLLAESIGKNEKTGFTPTVSVGTTDLHSMAQLYLGGPKDRTTMFVFALEDGGEIRVPLNRDFPEVSPSLSGRTFGEIMKAVEEGVKISFEKRELPFIEAIMSGISAYELGAFIQWKMAEIMYLADIMGVNAFDQPSVEDYKKAVKNILGN